MVGGTAAPKTCKRQAVAKQSQAKRQKAAPSPILVQTKLTTMEEEKKKAALAAKATEPAKATSPEELVELNDSSSDSDAPPRVVV
jgi:hypothetical protein